MPYFPVDDRFHSHPKTAAASLAALGLWAVAGSWANDHLTDGDVPEHMIPLLSRSATELAEELVTCGLWRRTKAGYRFHQWHSGGVRQRFGHAWPGSGRSQRRRHRPKVRPEKLRRIRLEVYERDGFCCVHCGWGPPVPEGYDGSSALGAVDRNPERRGLSPYRSLDLDHVHPYLLGGQFEVANLQTLCNTCNARKGAAV